MLVSTPARGGVRRARDQVGMPNGLRLATNAHMALESAILSGSSCLEQAVAGGPSVKKRPPDDDADAVRRIQNALVALGIPLPKSFPNDPGGAPDGVFGDLSHGGACQTAATRAVSRCYLASTRAYSITRPTDPRGWDALGASGPVEKKGIHLLRRRDGYRCRGLRRVPVLALEWDEWYLTLSAASSAGQDDE
jgi:hypothetical protein